MNVAVGLGYLEAWLRGIGCVPLFNLMEDAATSEISRAQLWQWVHHRATLEDGTSVTATLVDEAIAEELAGKSSNLPADRMATWSRAAEMMSALITAERFPDFLTLPAYAELLTREADLKDA